MTRAAIRKRFRALLNEIHMFLFMGKILVGIPYAAFEITQKSYP